MSEVPPTTASGKGIERPSRQSNQQRQRQLVSSACQACREKRIKCDGPPPPCEACLQRRRECLFDVDSDQRRRVARRHKADEAEFNQRLLYGLLKTIRSSEEPQVQDLLNCVQRGGTLEDIMAVIESHLDEPKREGSAGKEPSGKLHEHAQSVQGMTSEPQAMSSAPKLEEGQRGRSTSQLTSSSGGVEPEPLGGSRAHRKVMAVQELINKSLLCDVSARPWTTVTDSDRLVSHLMSFYFTWWDPFFRVVDQDTFVDAMKRKDLDTPFCSPFLVNAILSIACQVCDSPRIFMRDEDPTTRGEAFHDEAVRLWNEEQGWSCLTNLQGLCLLICSYNLRGRDKTGWAYLSQVIKMYDELSLARGPPVPKHQETGNTGVMDQSSKLAAWAAFSLTVEFSLVVLRPAYVDPPAYGVPFSEDSISEPNLATNELSDLMRLCWEIPPLLFDEMGVLRHDLTIDDIDDLTKEMKGWQDSLPEKLQPSSDSPSVVFEIHMFYYSVLITLFGFLISSDASPPLTDGTPDASLTSRITALVGETLPLFQLYDRRYGLDQPPLYLSHVAVAGANALLTCLDANDHQDMFVELVEIMVKGGRRIGLWQGTVLMLRRTAAELQINLPSGVDHHLEAFENEYWPRGGAESRARYNSIYPNYAFAMDRSRNNENFQMGDLLSRWTTLRLGGNGAEE